MAQTSETIRKDNPQKALQEEDEVTARAKAAFAEIRAMAERGERSTPYCISQKNVVPLHGIIFLILRQEYAI